MNVDPQRDQRSDPRGPRCNLDAERAVLGGILDDNDAMHEARGLAPDDFYSRANATMFEAMRALINAGRPADLVTLRAWLSDRGLLGKAGGDEHLVSLTETIPTVENIEHHIDLVRGNARLRRVIAAARMIEARASDVPVDEADAFAREAEAIIAEATHAADAPRGPVSMRECVEETFEALSAAAEGDTSNVIPTRFRRLNEILGGGFRSEELVLIAGRPGHGKTAIGLDLALSLAVHGPGIVFSLEMGRDAITRRAIAAEGRVDGNRIRTAKLSRADWTRATTAAGRLSTTPIDGLRIDDTPAATLSYIRSTSRREHARRVEDRPGVRWVVVDYLQLMRPDRHRENREAEVSEISRGLKALAKEIGVPVIALSQLNRAVELRAKGDRWPQLSDLRESGSLEQDADVVMFVHREELYKKRGEDPDPEDLGTADIIIGKQRSGPLASIKCKYLAEYTTFEELASFDDEARPDGTTRSVDHEDFEDL